MGQLERPLERWVRRSAEQRTTGHFPPRLVPVSLLAAGWAFLYALYRLYYGLGGKVGMFGTVTSESRWRAINLAGAAILILIALLPLIALPLWRRARLRRAVLVLCWLLAVGFIMHALIDDIQRVLSLAGVIEVRYPDLWATLNRREADIQDLVLNETWFLVEGILWGVLGLIGLGSSPNRRWWIGSALAAIAALVALGIASAFDLVGSVVVG